MRRLFAGGLCLVLAGCATTTPAVMNASVRPGAAKECAAACQTMGLALGAVVLYANSEGCVCEPQGSAIAPSRAAAGVAAAAAARAAREKADVDAPQQEAAQGASPVDAGQR